jgi:hypothetical protein
LKLLDDSWYFRQRERLPEWIARGDGVKGRLTRLVSVVGGLFLFFYVVRDRSQEADPWWLGPAILSSILVSIFALWRLIEWRRRVERRKNPPVQTLDLP